jgi:hypothetical protein
LSGIDTLHMLSIKVERAIAALIVIKKEDWSA